MEGEKLAHNSAKTGTLRISETKRRKAACVEGACSSVHTETFLNKRRKRKRIAGRGLRIWGGMNIYC